MSSVGFRCIDPIFKLVAKAEAPPGEEFTPIVKEYIDRVQEHVRNEKLGHAEERAEWEELKVQINSDIGPVGWSSRG